jgi:hypothetical protein
MYLFTWKQHQQEGDNVIEEEATPNSTVNNSLTHSLTLSSLKTAIGALHLTTKNIRVRYVHVYNICLRDPHLPH